MQVPNVKKALDSVRDKVFSNIHSNNLIYNTCWEDPRCDRQILHLQPDSQIVMITSAGCNALDYLLDNPKAIHCIDVNPRQNALLALKIALIKHTDHETLYQFFGEGVHPQAKTVYKEKIRPHLPEFAQKFWDKKISYFSGKGLKNTFYFHGTSGSFAWFFEKYVQTMPRTRTKIHKILESQSVEEQKQIYSQIEPKLINFMVRWIINRHLTLSLLGVPRAQRQLIIDEYPGGVAGFVTDAIRHIFTDLPIHENYFWRLYITGKYTPTCCPNYLRKENFDTLRQRVQNIHIHTSTMSQFLEANPDQYSHYILLDHQDWLAAHNVPALEDEWRLILKNSQAQTTILLRSAAMRVTFFPDFVQEKVQFIDNTSDSNLKDLHSIDRVGTYGSVYVGKMKP
ncbi:MAG: DUF3419 family protein [Cytophagales bacterium]|nr:MAG: DUF3419 family protein [Cytophagales bacterium]